MRDYGFAVAAVGLATGVCFVLSHLFDPTNLAMVYLLAILVVSAQGRRGPAVGASVLGVLCFDFFFVPPQLTFQVTDIQYLWTFGVLILTALVTSTLTLRLKAEAETAREGERRTAMMHALTEKLAFARDTRDIARLATAHLTEVFRSPVGIAVSHPKGLTLEGWNDRDRGMAQWVFDSGQPAGLGTETLSDSAALFVPLRGAETPAGVLRLESPTDAGQRQLLDSYAHQIGLSLEVARLAESARQAEIAAENERLRSSLLSMVSHDFRTPLTAILGSAGALLQSELFRGNAPARELLENIQAESERLSRLIHNLLEATRLESGTLRVEKEHTPLEEVVENALDRTKKILGSREVIVDLPEDLPLVPMDSLLIGQIFVNLLENAARYSPPASPIHISARVRIEEMEVTVADRGPGLTGEELERVFEKFYRGGMNVPGTGLGLAICRAIIKLHGGRIWAENRVGGGAKFLFTLPLEEETHGT